MTARTPEKETPAAKLAGVGVGHGAVRIGSRIVIVAQAAVRAIAMASVVAAIVIVAGNAATAIVTGVLK